jgi:gliding motility-associated-like protein
MTRIITLFFLFYYAFGFSQGDNCATAYNLGTLPTPAGCSGGATGVGTPVNHNGTNVGATAANPYVSIIDCGTGTADMASPALDVWYSFVASGPTAVISFSNITGTFGTPNIGLYTGTCNSLTPTGCDVDGSPGTFTGMVSGQTYYIQVSGSTSTGSGNFTISVQNNQECGDCLTQASLVANPPPVNGYYYPGQTVTFCYTVFTYNQVNTNWFHGVQLNFGAGWNMVSQSPPPGCSAGSWNYYPTGIGNVNGTNWGPGFYFESNLGCNNCNTSNPGDNYGDASASNCDLQFCWTMQVDAACPASSLNVTVNTSGDGESGSWSNLSCQGDAASSFDPNMSCCLPPTMTSTNTTCSNSSDGSATATATGTVSPWDYYWYDQNGTLITSTLNTTATNTLSNIPTGTYTVVVVDASNCSMGANVTVVSNPGATVTVPANIVVCNGATVATSSYTSPGFPTASYTWTNSNTNIGIPSSGTGNITSFTATNTGLTPITSTIVVTPYSGPNPATSCSGAPSSYTITVNPSPQLTLTASPGTSVCNGEPVTITGSYVPQPVVSNQTFQNSTLVNIPNGCTGPAGCQYGYSTVTSSGITPTNFISGQIVSICFTLRHEDYTEFTALILQVGNTVYTSQNPAPAPAGGLTYVYNASMTTLYNQVIATIQTGGNNSSQTATFCFPQSILTLIESAGGLTNTTWKFGITDQTGGADNGNILDFTVVLQDFQIFTYAWSSTDNSSITTSPLSGNTSGGTLTLNATPTSTTTYTLTVTGESGCPGTANITINVGSVTVSPPSTTPTVCQGSVLNPTITFTTTGATGIGAPIGLPLGVAASYSSNTITISGTPTSTGVFNYSIPVTGGCAPINALGTITVNPTNTVSAASSLPTVCIGTAIPNVTFTTSGATGIGVSSGLPNGVTASWFNNIITVFGTPTAAGTYNFTIPLTGGCGSVDATGTITVIALPIISLTSSGPFTCNATDGSITVTGTGTGNVVWSGPSSNTASSVALNYTINNVGAGTYNVYFVDANGCQSATEQISLANPGAPVLDIINDITNCGTTYSLPSITGPTLTAPAYYTGPNGTGSVVAVGTTYNAPTNITLYAYDANGACADEEPFTITINQIPTVNAPTNVLVCPGATIDPQDFVSVPAGATYSWLNTDIVIGLPTSGVGQILPYSAPANSTGAAITGSITVTPTLNGCVGTSSSFTIAIDPTPTVNSISNITACPGSTADPIDFSSNPLGSTFTWTNSNASIGLAISGSGQITPFSLSANNTGSNITSTISAQATLNGCIGPIQTFTITISPTPTITLTPTDPSICNGTDGSISVNTVAPGSVSWSGTASGNSGAMNISYLINNLSAGTYDVFFINSTTGCQSTTSSTTLLNPGAPVIDPIADFTSCGGFYVLQNITGTSLVNPQYYAQAGGNGSIISVGALFEPDTLITIYAYDANGACTAEQSFTIELISTPVITNPGPQTACDSYTLPVIVGTSLSGNQAYYSNSQLSGGILITGPVTSSQTVYIYDANGSCSDEESFVVTINNTPIITNLGPQSACETFSLPSISGLNLSGTEAYYTNTQANGGTVTTGPITSSQTLYVYDANGTCSDEESFVVTINPEPTIVSFTGGSTYCQGDVVSDLIATLNGSPDFTMYYSINGTSQTPLSSSTATFNLGSVAGVYQLDSLEDVNCINNSLFSTQTITINPIPGAPTAGKDTTYCSNANPVDLTASGAGSFTWYDDNNNALGTGATFTPDMSVGTTTYNVSQTVNGCEGPTSSVVIIVEECGIIVPTAFTPDNDNTNDFWILDNIDQIYPNNVVSIYNRWGNQIYQSKSGQYELAPWDGTYNSEKMPVGSYYFIIEYNDSFTQNLSGIVTLIKN